MSIYVQSEEGWVTRGEPVSRAFPDYQIMSALWQDAEWDSYLNFLMPDDEQRQTIENSRVCDVLKNHGDSLTVPREIDHWFEFSIATDRDRFQTIAEGIGFQNTWVAGTR